ncbi:hypothetical protein ABB02_00803 [Clostridiaceae bacterium JG1575]|nr:hypothetical protein ABB02_00803 [Clostridiaceae bacterium JG1575]
MKLGMGLRFRWASRFYREGERLLQSPSEWKRLMGEGQKILRGEGQGPLGQGARKLRLLLYMLEDARSGRYPYLPKKTLLALAGGLAYVLSPIDLIPDFLPGLGLLDDAILLGWLWRSCEADLLMYRQWLEREVERYRDLEEG